MGLRTQPWRILAAVVVVASAVGYLLFVKTSHVDPDAVSSLVIGHPGVKALNAKPVESQRVTSTTSAFATLKKAAAADPSATGGYGREWTGTKASGDVATQLIEVLPTAAEAKDVGSEAVADYADQTTLKAAHTTVTSRFRLPTVSGSVGMSFATASTSTTTAASGTAIVFEVGRAVSIGHVQSMTGGLTRADAITMADAERTLLAQREPGFSLVQTQRPFVVSLIYGLVSLFVIGLVLFVPGWLQRRRTRRQARQSAQARHEYRARGGKQLRRKRAPAWAQRAR